MPEIGETLRDARMRARIDVSEIEAKTKIRAKYLRALENEEWNLLPGNTYVKLGAPASTVDDTDRVTIARPAPGNGQEYKWFLFPGTVVKILGTQKASGDDFVHIQLDSTQDAWVLRSELQAENISTVSPTGFVGDTLAPVRRIGALRVVPGPDWIDVVIPVTGPPPPYLVEETDRTISLLLYGVTGASVVSMMAQPIDPYFNSISSSTPEQSRVRYTINLNRAPYGYLALWQNGEVTFRVRRPPRIADAASPLRGLTITVDPGHPPAGATGPTGLYEGDAVLQVGFRVRDLSPQILCLRNQGIDIRIHRLLHRFDSSWALRRPRLLKDVLNFLQY